MSSEQLGREFVNFRHLLNEFYSPHFDHSLLVGPDVAGNLDFVTGFLKNCKSVLHAATFHQYYGGGPSFTNVSDYMNINTLDGYRIKAQKFVQLVRNQSASLPVWHGETSSDYSPSGSASTMFSVS